MPFDHNLNIKLIRDHLFDHFDDNPFTGLSVSTPFSQWALQGRTFDPQGFIDPATLWVKELYAIVDERLTANEMEQIDGLTSFQVSYPFGFGTSQVENLTKEIKLAFKPAQSIQDASPAAQHIHIVNSTRLTGAADSDVKPVWWQQIVRIQWRSFSANT